MQELQIKSIHCGSKDTKCNKECKFHHHQYQKKKRFVGDDPHSTPKHFLIRHCQKKKQDCLW